MWDLDSAFRTSSSPSAEVSVQMKETNHEGGRKNAEARGMKVFWGAQTGRGGYGNWERGGQGR